MSIVSIRLRSVWVAVRGVPRTLWDPVRRTVVAITSLTSVETTVTGAVHDGYGATGAFCSVIRLCFSRTSPVSYREQTFNEASVIESGRETDVLAGCRHRIPVDGPHLQTTRYCSYRVGATRHKGRRMSREMRALKNSVTAGKGGLLDA
jgi:hypothetical protein